MAVKKKTVPYDVSPIERCADYSEEQVKSAIVYYYGLEAFTFGKNLRKTYKHIGNILSNLNFKMTVRTNLGLFHSHLLQVEFGGIRDREYLSGVSCAIRFLVQYIDDEKGLLGEREKVETFVVRDLDNGITQLVGSMTQAIMNAYMETHDGYSMNQGTVKCFEATS